MEEEKRDIYKGYYLMLLQVEGEHEDDEMGYAVSIQNKEYEQYEMTWVMDRPEFAKKMARDLIDCGEIERLKKFFDE